MTDKRSSYNSTGYATNDRRAKLSEEQWYEVCDYITEGHSQREAVKFVQEKFDVRITQGAISQNKHVKKTLLSIKQNRQLETQQAIEESLPRFCKFLLSNMEEIQERRQALTEASKKVKAGGSEHRNISKAINELDRVSLSYSDQYTKLLDLTGGVSFSDDSADSTEDLVKALLDKLDNGENCESTSPETLDQFGIESLRGSIN